jgi:hypothetical protein
VGAALFAMGATQETADQVAGGSIAAIDAYAKQSVQMAFDATAALTKRPAAAEVVMQIKANPNIAMNKQAQIAVMDYIDGVAKWKQDRQQAKDAWLAQPGASYKGFEGAFNRDHPIDQYVPSPDALRKTLTGADPALGASKAGPAAPRVGEVRDGYTFTGGDPASPSSWKR